MFLLSGAEGRDLMATGTPRRCSGNAAEQMDGLDVEEKKRNASLGLACSLGRVIGVGMNFRGDTGSLDT